MQNSLVRLTAIQKITNDAPFFNYPFLDYELVALNSRMICENFVQGSLILNSAFSNQVELPKTREYAKEILKKLCKHDELTFPTQETFKLSSENKAEQQIQIPQSLSRDDFYTLYDLCNDILHCNPDILFSDEIPKIYKKAKIYFNLMYGLLESHQIGIINSDILIGCRRTGHDNFQTFAMKILTSKA